MLIAQTLENCSQLWIFYMKCPQCHHAIRPRQIDTQYQFITIVRSHTLCPDYVLWLFQFNSIGKFPDKNKKLHNNFNPNCLTEISQPFACESRIVKQIIILSFHQKHQHSEYIRRSSPHWATQITITQPADRNPNNSRSRSRCCVT